MIMMKMRKKILAMKGVSCALVKFAVKSNSPISIANTWNVWSPAWFDLIQSGLIWLFAHFDECILEASKSLGGREENVEHETEGEEQSDKGREEREDGRSHLDNIQWIRFWMFQDGG